MINYGSATLGIYYIVTTFLAFILLPCAATFATFTRVVSGWDRIYLLPLSIPEIEQNMLRQL
jgi:hypothetical protein